MNPLHPNKMTTEERIAEVAEILSAGLIRLQAAQSTKLSQHSADRPLDRAATARMHGRDHHPGVPA
jgi:hypothetical protein